MYVLPGGTGSGPHIGTLFTSLVVPPVAPLVPGAERSSKWKDTWEDLVTVAPRIPGTVSGTTPIPSLLGPVFDPLVHSPGNTSMTIRSDTVSPGGSVSSSTSPPVSHSYFTTHAVPDWEPVCL